MSTRHLAAVVVLLAPLLAARPSAAQPADELPVDPRARALLEDGLRAFDGRNYTDAIDSFRRGYGLEQRRVFLFAWAQAERLSGDCASARPLYQRFLAESPPPEQTERAREGLSRCPENTPAPAPAPSPTTRRPVATAATPAPSPRPFWTDPIGDVLVGAGAAALVTALALTLVAEGDASDANEAETLADWRSSHDAAGDERLSGAIVAGIGVALVAVGVTHFLIAPRTEDGGETIGRGGIVIARWRP